MQRHRLQFAAARPQHSTAWVMRAFSCYVVWYILTSRAVISDGPEPSDAMFCFTQAVV
jgi:hypothetical protein